MHQTRVGMWLIVCLWAMRGVAAAQVGGGRITGIVTDQAGAAVPGATVTSTNRETGALRTTVSSSSGIHMRLEPQRGQKWKVVSPSGRWKVRLSPVRAVSWSGR